MSLTLDPRKVSDLEEQLDGLKEDLGKMANVSARGNLAIVSLICNVQRTSAILEKASGRGPAQNALRVATGSPHRPCGGRTPCGMRRQPA